MLFRTNLAEQKAFCSILFGSFSLVFQKNVFRMTLVKDILNTKTDQRRSLSLQEEKIEKFKTVFIVSNNDFKPCAFQLWKCGGGVLRIPLQKQNQER